MELTTREAAARLGVTQSRVRALIAGSGLRARRIGVQWLIDSESLDRQVDLVDAQATGRPMSRRIAWAASDLADGGRAAWLQPNERLRLRRRLSRSATVGAVQRWLRTRGGERTVYRIGVEDLETLLRIEGVVATGRSAVAFYGLGLGVSAEAECYVSEELERRLVDELFMIPAASGNVALRRTEGSWHLATARCGDGGQVAPRLIVGADLCSGGDVRTRSAGRDLIARALEERRWE